MAKRTSADADADGAATSEELQHKKKHQRVDEVSTVKEVADMEGSGPTVADNGVSNDNTKHQQSLCCSGCGISDSAANGSLLLFDDPEEDNKEEDDQQLQPGDKTGNNEEKRYCAECMTDKKVRVFWPVDQQWYIATVLKFDSSTGQHLLRYPDGDTEWVRIGEDHTTKVQYREYFNALKRAESMGGGPPDVQMLGRLPSLTNAVSFGLGQSFGMYPMEDEKTMRLKGGPSQQRQLMNQLNLNLTEMSSMSSFGLNNNGSFGMGRNGGGGGAAQPFQLLPPNFSHSFSSKNGEESGPVGPPHLPYGSWEKKEGGGPHYWQPHYGGYYHRPPDDEVAETAPRGKGKGRGGDDDASKDVNNNKKALAKAWLKIEDERLLDLVLQMKHPLKWSVIASSLSSQNLNPGVPERTGKQCRERYVNHLNPRLKTTDFTPIEDATIWRMFATVGTKWAIMSKIIPGRTDNNLKNRFHNLKRQLGREEDARSRASLPKNIDEIVHTDKIRKIPSFLTTKIEDMWNAQDHIPIIVANTVEGDGDEQPHEPVGEEGRHRDFFGPFIPIEDKPVQCLRCGMFAPSLQCGTEICSKTKWCKSCTKAPMHIGGNVLRECLSLRKGKVN
mmetsp:Transcript_27125/g.38840  ORF Transcript_27125/g.38840 Transcript_27125/m.38840 type:complete len:614 (+) Transcript_27125:155-1996(+)